MPTEKKQSRYGGRLDPKLRERLDDVHAKHLTTDSAVIHALLHAFCDEVEHQGAVRWPVTLSMAPAQLRAVAEDQTRYEHAPPKPPDKSKRATIAGPAHRVSKSA